MTPEPTTPEGRPLDISSRADSSGASASGKDPSGSRSGSRGARAAQLASRALPPPGSGSTLTRWEHLARWTAADIVEGRLAEAHHDAHAIAADLDAPGLISLGSHWGVWAAEPPEPRLRALLDPADGTWLLTGTKPWCSGASSCTHALITADEAGTEAQAADAAGSEPADSAAAGDPGDRRVALFAVDLQHPGVRAVPDTWHAVGMADSDSGWVEFSGVPAQRMGSHTDYVDRPGFWHGGMGVAACWFGGARAIAQPLLQRAARSQCSPLIRAHAGAVAAELAAGWALLRAAAEAVDSDPLDRTGANAARALIVRTRIDRMATTVLERVGRALGAGPLCADAAHARRAADLTVYIRQTHAEADEAQIAALLSDQHGWDALIGIDLGLQSDAGRHARRADAQGRP